MKPASIMTSVVALKPSPADEELARRVSRGDRRAFLDLYDRYAARVYGLALRMIQEAMAAEEVTQDTFVKLWGKAGAYDPSQGAFPTWLLSIARNTALDWIRRETRRPALEVPLENTAGWEPTASLSAAQADESRWRSLRFALRDLPAEQSQVIELAYFHGMSHSHIAQHLDLPLGTVKTRIRLGMEKLRRAWLGKEAAG